MSGHNRHTWNLSPVVVGLIGLVAGGIIITTFRCAFLYFFKRRRTDLPITNEQEMVSRPGSTIFIGSSMSSSSSGVKNIPISHYSKEKSDQKETTCAICLSDFVEGEQIRALPECFHFFHVPCIDAWLDSRSKCPICRANSIPPPYAQTSSAQTSSPDSTESPC
ncbi:hypothetical protein ACFE04_000739 [Oxalis oulophora]